MSISTKSSDVVAVLNSNLSQVFVNASVIKVSVTEESQVMSHPVESGSTIEDEVVFLPTTVTLNFLLSPSSYRSTYQEIKQLYKKREILTVQTKSDSYQSLVIENMPHDEDASIYDTIAISIRLREVNFIETEYEAYTPKKVRNPADASNKKTGEAKTSDASDRYKSIASKIGKDAGKAIGL